MQRVRIQQVSRKDAQTDQALRVVDMHGDRVVKHEGAGRLAGNEVIRSRAAAVVAPRAQIVVPRVIEASQRCIVFERIDALEPLDVWLSQRPDAVVSQLHRVGAALAAVHADMSVPTGEVPDSLPVSANEHVALHGDFTVINIGLSRGRLVVLDWAPPDWARADNLLTGPPEWDIALFLVSLYLRRPRDPKPIAHLGHGVDAFVSGYRSRRRIDLRALPAFYRWMIVRALPNEVGWARRVSRAPQLLHGYLRTQQVSRRG